MGYKHLNIDERESILKMVEAYFSRDSCNESLLQYYKALGITN